MTEKLDQKLARRQAASASANEDAAPKLREKKSVVEKIAAYKQKDPKFAEYVKTLPRERLENIAILRQVENVERDQRIRTAVDRPIIEWLEKRPEIKAEIEARIANTAPEKREAALIRLGRIAAEREGLKQTGPSVSGPKL